MQTVTINSTNLSTFGIKVTKIRGVFDMPGRYGTYEYDWQDVDGIDAFVEVDDIYFKQRQISLDCIMEADSINEFQYNLGLFRDLVYQRVTLSTPYSSHDCILKEGAKVIFLGNKYSNQITASFQLVFNEISYSFGTTLESDPTLTNDVFSIDRIALSRFGIIVEESDGNFDFPSMKDDKNTRYMRESDTVNMRNTRDIELRCTMSADNLTEFSTKMAQFHGLLAQSGLRSLMLPLVGLETSYEVFCPNGFTLSELYQADNGIDARFTIILREVNPVSETVFLTILFDNEGVPILTADGEYIYIICDRKDLGGGNVYLYKPTEGIENPFLWTKAELDPIDPDYNELSDEVYLYLTEEI